ncbi:MBL fold metallo-hydrolase [Alicyclobacillus sp. SO9]|uniref:MBL fold metallo-hydrolase n=1 Tax=Alicyclobacillus sp. SO9 TaxID=2665646 RepID=UPI0018E8450E|nr:MBL fold metallo-hydrolase [Alicyclobacillus sp. SO9]
MPTETFESKWSFQGTAREVQCHTLGGGHTASDSLLYLPNERICFVGDLIAIQNHMLVVDGDIHYWISILEKLNQWDIDTIVPGHGPVGGKQWISQAQVYLQHLLDQVNTLKQEGRSTKELSSTVMPEAYQEWSAKELYTKNLQHLGENIS